MRPRYAQVHLLRWTDAVVWAYDAIADNIVWGNSADDNIVWGNADNIVWGNLSAEQPAWGTGESDNVVWGLDDNIVWGNADNIVWGNSADDNIVWGNGVVRGVWASNVVSGFWDDNIVWGNVTLQNIDNIVWGNQADNIVWGNDDNIVWGNDETAVEFAAPSTATITDWRSALPSLTGARLTLRELRAGRRSRAPGAGVHRGSVALHFAAANHHRGFRALHCVDAPRATRGQLRVFRHRARGPRCGHRALPGALAQPGFGTAEWGFAMGCSVLGHRVVRRMPPPGRRSISPSTCWVCHASRPAPWWSTGTATPALRSSAPCKKACCGARSCAADTITIRCRGRSWRWTGNYNARGNGP